MGTWEQACSELLKDEDFGYSLSRDNGWLNDVMDEASGKAKDNLGKGKEYLCLCAG